MNNKLQYHLIPTEDESILWINPPTDTLYSLKKPIVAIRKLYKPHHLYLTSDAEIKEGDWCYTKWGIDKCSKVGIDGIRYFDKLSMCWNTHEFESNKVRKIELATDPELIADGIPAIDGKTKATYENDEEQTFSKEFLEVNFLEEFCKRWNEKGKIVCWNCGAEKKVLTGLCSSCGRFHINQKDNQKVDVEKLAKDHAEESMQFFSPTKEAYRLRAKNSFLAGIQALQSQAETIKDLEECCDEYANTIYKLKTQSQAGGFSLQEVKKLLEEREKRSDYWSAIKRLSIDEWLKGQAQSLTKETPKGGIVIECEMENVQKPINYHKDLWHDEWKIKLKDGQPIIHFK